MRRTILALAAPTRLLAVLPVAAVAVLALPLPQAAHAQEHGGHDQEHGGRDHAAADSPDAAYLDREIKALALDAGQVTELEEVRDAMQEEARRFGAEIVRLERELDRAFSAGTVTEATLRETTAAVAHARGRLRAVHLSAHLATRRILSEGQTRRYEELRGYGPGSP